MKMTVELDDLDYAAVQAAIAERQRWRVMPTESTSCTAGRALAEICRAFLERPIGSEHDESDDADWWKE